MRYARHAMQVYYTWPWHSFSAFLKKSVIASCMPSCVHLACPIFFLDSCLKLYQNVIPYQFRDKSKARIVCLWPESFSKFVQENAIPVRKYLNWWAWGHTILSQDWSQNWYGSHFCPNRWMEFEAWTQKNLIGLEITLTKLISLEILGTDLKSVITAKFSL